MKSTVTEEELIAALETGHKASSVLHEVLSELVLHHTCPDSVGFEGPGTFFECGECIVCLANRVLVADDDGGLGDE